MPDPDLIRVIRETPDPLTGTPARVVVQFFYDPDEQENYEEADRLIAAIAARVERYYAERPVSDAEVEAAAKAMFELRPAYMGSGPNAERWTWEKASPDNWRFGRDNARAALEAARKARGRADAAN